MAILILGMITGALIGILVNNELQRYSIRSLLRTLKKELHFAYEEGIKFGKVQPKIERINEISNEQLKYVGALDQPNASAAHARHKNTIVSQIKALEAEKLELFRSILKSGADPMLTVAIDGTTKNMRASELLPFLESGNPPPKTNPESKTDSNTPGSTRTLRIVSNTKENKDESNPSDPAVH